jgi:hypothetical protein
MPQDRFNDIVHDPHAGINRPAASHRGRALLRRPRAGVVLLALLLAIALWSTISLTAPGGLLPLIRGADHPTAGIEAADRPLGQPPAVLQSSSQSSSYRLQEAPDPGQEFVAYDPCRPIHYVVRPDHGPANGQELIRQAVARVSEATGLQFTYDGGTDEAPQPERPRYQPERYGDRWAPVLIAWSTEADTPELAGQTVALSGSAAVAITGKPWVFVTGQLVLDAPHLTEIQSIPGGTDAARAVVMHELGHVVGLDHVEDRSQLMHPETSLAVTEFGPGDLAGLAKLGQGPCVPEL